MKVNYGATLNVDSIREKFKSVLAHYEQLSLKKLTDEKNLFVKFEVSLNVNKIIKKINGVLDHFKNLLLEKRVKEKFIADK